MQVDEPDDRSFQRWLVQAAIKQDVRGGPVAATRAGSLTAPSIQALNPRCPRALVHAGDRGAAHG